MTRDRFARIAGDLRAQYRAAACAGDWTKCLELPGLMDTTRTEHIDELAYARAYALEHLGRVEEARAAYQQTLAFNGRHTKALRRLQRLETR